MTELQVLAPRPPVILVGSFSDGCDRRIRPLEVVLVCQKLDVEMRVLATVHPQSGCLTVAVLADVQADGRPVYVEVADCSTFSELSETVTSSLTGQLFAWWTSSLEAMPPMGEMVVQCEGQEALF